MAGMVYIVGAGPGDPWLISVRGQRYLALADVVVHDTVVHPRILRLARPDAERIDVGSAAPQPLQQEAISLLIAEKAREGRTVVRLKWGDPYVFDSGGKEALFLHEQGVPFEVVPGVTMPVAGPCYAGVPVTYPGAGDTLTFIRGHEDGSNAPPRLDWEALARLEGTIVCYAGPRQLLGVVDELIGHGRSPDDWTAVIYNGTLPSQRTLHGTLGALKAKLERIPEARDPGILVVGPVAGLREYLRWFDSRPLFGKRVLVTRSKEQAAELVDLLEQFGAEAVEAPAIRVAPPDDFQSLDLSCADAGTFDWIVFSSENAVDVFMRRLLAGACDVRDLKGPRLCAIGPATADRLARYGIKVDLMPVEYHTDAIIDAIKRVTPLDGARVLFPHAEVSRELLAEELRRAGADVREVVVYRRVREPLAHDGDRDVYKMLLEGRIDAVLFASATSVIHFVETIGQDQAADLLRTVVVACIGPVTAEAAQTLGIHASIVPEQHTLPGLVAALVDYYRTAG